MSLCSIASESGVFPKFDIWQQNYNLCQKVEIFVWKSLANLIPLQTAEFTKATVVTTVDTTTAPLSEVYFPAVTICNINQVLYIYIYIEL
jgi:hypothetical protein